jgi:hypothetical protein
MVTMKARSPSRRRLRAAGLVAGALALAAVGCNELVRSMIQTKLDQFWTDPAKKASTEATAATKLDQAIEQKLAGQEFEVPGPNPYLHDVEGVKVDLGTRSPAISIPGTVTSTQTDTAYYLTFDWEADWPKGNEAKVDMHLDLRSHSFFLAYEYPDHDLHLRDIDAWAKGKAMVVIPKNGGKATATITLSGATLDLTAKAEGWFWTIDVSKQIKGQLNDKLLRDLVGKAIDVAFAAQV